MKLKDIKSLCEAATSGNWVHLNDEDCIVFDNELMNVLSKTEFEQDAAFIAASRTLVPALVAEVEALRDALEDVANDRTGRMNIRIANKALTNQMGS